VSNETRVKEALNLIFHGIKISQREQMFTEVREWLNEVDPPFYAYGSERCRWTVSTLPLVQCALQTGHAGEHRALGDLRLTDFEPDKMADRLRVECEMREEASRES
jgi:hypothetical protein